MDLPNLSQLPPWAVVVFVVCLAVLYAATRFGWLQGALKGGGASEQSHAQVAAVIVDPTALLHATAAVEALNMTLLEIKTTGKSMSRASIAAASNTGALTDEVEKLTASIDRLRDELIRAAAKIE